jgi:hypothetical protein
MMGARDGITKIRVPENRLNWHSITKLEKVCGKEITPLKALPNLKLG